MTENTPSGLPAKKQSPSYSSDVVPLTKGERVFDEITYRGVDWLMNSAIGVAFTYWTARTLSGKQHFSEPVTSFFMKNLKPFFKTEEGLKEGANWGNSITSIMVGGFTTIPPIMWLEANKKPIVKALDRKIYGDKEVDTNPDLNAAYNAIDQEPAKNFTIGTVTRFISLAPIFWAVTKYPQQLNRYLYEPIGNASKWACKQVGFKNEYLMNRTLPDEFGKPLSDWDYIHRTIGFDFGLTLAYSYIHEYTYKTMSAMFETTKGEAEKTESHKASTDQTPHPFRAKEIKQETAVTMSPETPKPLGFSNHKPDTTIAERHHVAALKDSASHSVGAPA